MKSRAASYNTCNFQRSILWTAICDHISKLFLLLVILPCAIAQSYIYMISRIRSSLSVCDGEKLGGHWNKAITEFSFRNSGEHSRWCTSSSLVPRLSPSTRAIYVRINTREGKEGESLVVNRALPVRGQQLTRSGST